MSTYSHAQHFPESLAGLLRQTYSPLEIIVLVDGAHSDSLALLQETHDPRLRFITTPAPSGMIPAWNKVCGEAQGKYLLYCADDDVLLPGAIDKQVEQMERHSNISFSHADFIYMDEAGTEIGRWVSPRGEFVRPGIEAWKLFVNQTRCCMQTTVVRRSCWEQVGGWDNDAPGIREIIPSTLSFCEWAPRDMWPIQHAGIVSGKITPIPPRNDSSICRSIMRFPSST